MGIAGAAALLAAGLAMGLGALGSGFGLGLAAISAIRAVERQPAKRTILFRNMLVGQAVTETPAIFALMVALLLYFSLERALDAPWSPARAAAFLGAGLCIGVGALGSGFGSGLIAHDALDGMSANPSSQGSVLLLMLIGQAWAQTGCIFALVVSLFLVSGGAPSAPAGAEDLRLWSLIPLAGGEMAGAARNLGSSLAMGLGAVGSSLGIAFAGGRACRSLAAAPAAGARIRAVYFIGSATAQSPSVFSLIVALILLLGA
ncbi:MAG: hypothetical protein LBU64_05720 [Planctomycetota bacterium]|jgi:F0F1-type ATP synthase membrane subunit c/vacuolar-type H+-ATPase subunit K|nr:hypothetical protein [Planctomycetota bacterium]